MELQEPLLEAPPTALMPASAPDAVADAALDAPNGFSTGLLDCCEGADGSSICCLACCLPCVAHGIVGDAAGGQVGRQYPCAVYTAAVLCLPAVFTLPLRVLARSKLRARNGMSGNICAGAAPFYRSRTVAGRCWPSPCLRAPPFGHGHASDHAAVLCRCSHTLALWSVLDGAGGEARARHDGGLPSLCQPDVTAAC